jgi:hypothetical protein
MSLDLKIENNLIKGRGSDVVGEFTLDGSYSNSGSVTINKQYLSAHLVIYTGIYKNNRIDGQWIIPPGNENTGIFQLNWASM